MRRYEQIINKFSAAVFFIEQLQKIGPICETICNGYIF